MAFGVLDGRERFGYLATNGSFFLAKIGTSETESARIEQNAQGNAYYLYPKSLGLPLFTYGNQMKIVIDKISKEEMVSIPISSSIHTHPYGGVSIDFLGSKSQNDINMAFPTIYSSLSHYVVEIFNKHSTPVVFKVGTFHEPADFEDKYDDVIMTTSVQVLANYVN